MDPKEHLANLVPMDQQELEVKFNLLHIFSFPIFEQVKQNIVYERLLLTKQSQFKTILPMNNEKIYVSHKQLFEKKITYKYIQMFLNNVDSNK